MKLIIIQLITAAFASFGFAILFNTRGKKVVISALGGLVAWGSFLIFARFIDNTYLGYFLASIVAMIYAEFFAVAARTPTMTFIVPSIVPLVPGGAFYYAVRNAIQNDLQQSLLGAIDTIAIAISIAGGIVAVSTVVRAYRVLKEQLKTKRQVGADEQR